jgi:hypothetical protein
MHIRRAVIIPAMLAFGVAGSVLAGSAAIAAPAVQASVVTGVTGGQPGVHYHTGPDQPGLHYHAGPEEQPGVHYHV